MRKGIAAIALALAWMSPAWAEEDSAEIVVTGARLQSFDDLQLPHITMKRRADSVIISLEVRSDTRDFGAA